MAKIYLNEIFEEKNVRGYWEGCTFGLMSTTINQDHIFYDSGEDKERFTSKLGATWISEDELDPPPVDNHISTAKMAKFPKINCEN